MVLFRSKIPFRSKIGIQFRSKAPFCSKIPFCTANDPVPLKISFSSACWVCRLGLPCLKNFGNYLNLCGIHGSIKITGIAQSSVNYAGILFIRSGPVPCLKNLRNRSVPLKNPNPFCSKISIPFRFRSKVPFRFVPVRLLGPQTWFCPCLPKDYMFCQVVFRTENWSCIFCA